MIPLRPLLIATLCALSPLARAADAPKKILVVSVTTGFRHSAIPLSEKILTQLAEKSGAFTLDFIEQPPGHPATPKKLVPLKPGATAEQKAAYQASLQAAQEAEKTQAPEVAAWNEKLKTALQKLSPDNLKQYDAIIFDSTTGDLPLPDPDGFLAWIKQGHAFIGIHSATDTFHHWPAYIDMIGAEFVKHGAQLPVQCINMDPKHPSTAQLPSRWSIGQEEIYNFRSYDPTKVHELLTLDISPLDRKTPGHFPISWCKMYGQGRVFYTALGHREDLWDTNPIAARKNTAEVAAQYQQTLLGGITWALGLAPGDATPQMK